MSAQPATIYTLPDKSTQLHFVSPHKKKRVIVKQSPRQIKATSSYCFAATDDLFRDLLYHATELRLTRDEPFSFQAACASIVLDRDRDGIRKKADYARIWGWSEQQLRSRWSEVLSTVESWKTMFGRAKNANGTITDDQRNDNGKQLDSNENSHGANGTITDDQRNPNGHTNTASAIQLTAKKEGEEGDPPSTIDENPDAEHRAYNTRYGWPDSGSVVKHCLEKGIPEVAAKEIWKFYTKVGWRLKGGQQIGDWRIAVEDNYRASNRRPAAQGDDGRPFGLRGVHGI